MQYWKRLTHSEMDDRISAALNDNINYRNNISLGIPASKLDTQVFHDQASFLKDAPLLRAYVQNPNHIGCHTLGESEFFFRGTQKLEQEVIELLAVDMLKAKPNESDGYVAAGGTEANIQAAWIYRNYFLRSCGAKQEQIALIGSEDTHYSIAKAANLLHLNWYSVAVDESTRLISHETVDNVLKQAMADGVRYCIVIANMATTMFGSIDSPDIYVTALQKLGLNFKLHVDGAFGGFIYPISADNNTLNFTNHHVSSITLDAHKMLQAPYGTGIFICRKGLMEFAYTKEAQYVSGMDITLSGSRSGANAIAVWMILFTYGPFGWLEKINKLLYRTSWCCAELTKRKIRFYRHPQMNIITIKATDISEDIAWRFGLVPDKHEGKASWYKIVVMDHVEIDHLQQFMTAIDEAMEA
ncbi:MAG: aspartate aminotransferase family protein [Bacteroidetes bacterium]|nr:aspartate aminotransferase family protein [Bacteroidota bacterium]